MEVTQATLSDLRRELHRYPELALEEHHTAQVIELVSPIGALGPPVFWPR